MSAPLQPASVMTLEQLQAEHERLRTRVATLESLLSDAWEVLDNYADVVHVHGEDPHYVPNDALAMRDQIDAVLG